MSFKNKLMMMIPSENRHNKLGPPESTLKCYLITPHLTMRNEMKQINKCKVHIYFRFKIYDVFKDKSFI